MKLSSRAAAVCGGVSFKRVAGLAALCALALLASACAIAPATTAGQPEAAAPAVVDAGKGPQPPAAPIMPPEPAERNEAALFAEADLRTEALREGIEDEISRVVPGPFPEPKEKKKKKKKKKKPAPAPEPAAPAKAEKAVAASQAPAAKAPVESFAPREEGAIPELNLLEKYSTANGLPSNLVTSIFVDETEAWIGTSGGGVARYIFSEGNWIVTSKAEGLTPHFSLLKCFRYAPCALLYAKDSLCPFYTRHCKGLFNYGARPRSSL